MPSMFGKARLRTNASETAFVEAVDAWLEGQGFETYHEVTVPGFSDGRADVVGKHLETAELVIVEVKARLSLDVLAQAERWVEAECAHRVYAAVPRPERIHPARGLAMRIAEQTGYGMLHVTDHGITVEVYPREGVEPRKGARTALEAALVPERRHQIGGTNWGGYWTPFRGTCTQIVKALEAAGPNGLSTVELVAGINHHYRTDRSALTSLPRYLQNGVIPGVMVVPGSSPMRWRMVP